MKANELRIGNNVYYGVNVVSIVGIHTQTYPSSDNSREVTYYINPMGNMNYYPVYENTIEPISLTEEWLLKFGFIKGSMENCYYKNWGINGVEVVVYEYHYKEGFEYEIGANRYNPIKYVHQLQNLYFALTGEELEVKPM